MLLTDTAAVVKGLIESEKEIGVRIQDVNDVPEEGPTNKGVWFRIEGVTAVFADMKRSTQLNHHKAPSSAAKAYAYFVRSMAAIADQFGARYTDIQGDAVFALFSGSDSIYSALASAVTMRTITEVYLSRRCRRVRSQRVGSSP